jgi:hypothetical protein
MTLDKSLDERRHHAAEHEAASAEFSPAFLHEWNENCEGRRTSSYRRAFFHFQ